MLCGESTIQPLIKVFLKSPFQLLNGAGETEGAAQSCVAAGMPAVLTALLRAKNVSMAQ